MFFLPRFSVERKQAKAFFISVSQFLAAPCIISTLLVPSVQASYGLLFLAYLTAETWLGPAAAIIQVWSEGSLIDEGNRKASICSF